MKAEDKETKRTDAKDGQADYTGSTENDERSTLPETVEDNGVEELKRKKQEEQDELERKRRERM